MADDPTGATGTEFLDQFLNLKAIIPPGVVTVDDNPVIYRFLIQTHRTQGGIEYTYEAFALAEAAAKAIRTDWKNFDILGLTIYEMVPGTYYNTFVGTGSYFVDVVVRLNEWQVQPVSGDKVAGKVRDNLAARGISNADVSTIGWVAVGAKSTSDLNMKIASFWNSKTVIYQWQSSSDGGNGNVEPTQQFAIRKSTGALPVSADDAVTFSFGLSDYPDMLLPLDLSSSLKKKTGVIPIGDGIVWDIISEPVVAGVSLGQMGVFVLFGYVGYMALKAWKDSHG
jgi:hypothetical protein